MATPTSEATKDLEELGHQGIWRDTPPHGATYHCLRCDGWAHLREGDRSGGAFRVMCRPQLPTR